MKMFCNFKKTLIKNITLLVFEFFNSVYNRILFSEESNFAMYNNLVLASFRKINLIFIYYLFDYKSIVAFHEMSSFVVIRAVMLYVVTSTENIKI